MITKRQVLSYVRNRDAMPAAEKQELFAPENLKTTQRLLKELIQDIDAQFIAHEARLADMAATAATAEREGLEVIEIQVGTDDDDQPICESHAPAIALNVFTAKELRWKVRTTRFRNLIESAMDDADEHANEIADARLSLLLAAVEQHKAEMEGDAGEEDEDLYSVAESLKSRTA